MSFRHNDLVSPFGRRVAVVPDHGGMWYAANGYAGYDGSLPLSRLDVVDGGATGTGINIGVGADFCIYRGVVYIDSG